MSKVIYPSLREKPVLVSGGVSGIGEAIMRSFGSRAPASAPLIYWKKPVHRSPTVAICRLDRSTLVSERGAWANIPPRCNATGPSASVRASTAPATRSNGSSTGPNSVGGLRRATTNSPPITWPSFSSHRSGDSCVLISPRSSL